MKERTYNKPYNRVEDKRNPETYNEDYETRRFHKLLKTIYSVCDFAGFHIEERIVLKDNRTGRVWK